MWVYALSPGLTESQVDANSQLASACDSVWPGLACTCVDLRWLGLTLVPIKFARKSISATFSPFGHPTQVNASWVTPIKRIFCGFRVLARKLASPFGHPTQVSTQVQLLATCDHLCVRLTRASKMKVRPCRAQFLAGAKLVSMNNIYTHIYIFSLVYFSLPQRHYSIHSYLIRYLSLFTLYNFLPTPPLLVKIPLS